MAIVVATFAYNTAMQQEMIPRKTFVPEPLKTASGK
jgi:hypothetical protein